MPSESLWQDRREKAGWALDTTRMAKSGYAPKKAELARWVVEAAKEIERLQVALRHAQLAKEDAEKDADDAEQTLYFQRPIEARQ